MLHGLVALILPMPPCPPCRSNIDLLGLHPGSLALLHSLDEKLVYGWFRVRAAGVP